MPNYDPDDQLITSLPLMNVRELGGMPLEGDRLFANGRFLRSASPSELKSESEVKAVKDYGVGVVIDLRSEAELNKQGNPFMGDPDVEFHSIPLFLGDPGSIDDKTMIYLKTHTMGDFYINVTEELKSGIAEVMRVFITADRLVLFHCAHGKDRTGIIAALLYLLAGARREDIVLNYKVSYGYLKDFLDPLIAKAPDALKHTLRSDASNMEQLLDHIENKYGDVREYLDSCGLTKEEQDLLLIKCLKP